MTTKLLILVGLGILISLYTFRMDSKQARIIVFAQVIAIILTIIGSVWIKQIVMAGWAIYLLSLIVASLYSLLPKFNSLKPKLIVSFICIPVLIANCFLIMHWPYYGHISLAMAIPVTTCFIALISTFKGKWDVMGLITIATLDASYRLWLGINNLNL